MLQTLVRSRIGVLNYGQAILSFQSWFFSWWKPNSKTTFCLPHLNASQITLKQFNVKKINISNARFKKFNKTRAETSRWPEFWSLSSPDKNPIDSRLWFFLKSNVISPTDANMNHKKQFFFRRNMHKRQFFLPYFRNQICKQTIVCFILYRLSFEKWITYCTKQHSLVILKIWCKSVSRCKSYFIFFWVREFLTHPYIHT